MKGEESNDAKELFVFNKYHWALEWPKIWIVTLGILLILLDLIILGVEIGHTVADVYRSTAFGGIILFLPLLTSAIFVLVTAFYPRLVLLRTAAILSIVMIVLCIILIDYDIIVLVDPTRCFFLDCNSASVAVNSSTSVTGWPLTISWPTAFQSAMNTKRICQSVQILATALFILFSICYLLTFAIYRNLDLYCQTTTEDHDREQSELNFSSITTQRQTQNQNQSSNRVSPEARNIKEVIVYKPRPESENVYDKLCTHCLREPRMRLASDRELYSYLCRNCYQDSNQRRQSRPATVVVKRQNHRWYDYY